MGHAKPWAATMNKKLLSETDIRTKFITPAICGAGWNLIYAEILDVPFAYNSNGDAFLDTTAPQQPALSPAKPLACFWCC